MGRSTVIILCILIAALAMTAGCISTGPGVPPTPTPTPQIIYVTILVTPSPSATATATPTLTGTTPTPAPTSSSGGNNIIGVWRYYAVISPNAQADFRIRFNGDGTYTRTYYDTKDSAMHVISGTWSRTGDNSVVASDAAGSNTFVYVPGQDIIYIAGYSQLLYTRYQGDVTA